MKDFTILIIDDEDVQRNAIAGFLRKRGFRVETAPDGTRGVACVRDQHFDLVLTDFRMPDISGADVLREVHSINPAIPVILITAYGSIESAVDVMKQGAFDYVQKPVDLDELLLNIERAREHVQLVSENRVLRQQLAERYSFSNIISVSYTHLTLPTKRIV